MIILWTSDPVRDARVYEEWTRPKSIGVCEQCSDLIFDFEDYYEINGNMVHEDCLTDWAEQFKKGGKY